MATYYLSETGDDTASGTAPNSAWRSLARASAAVYEDGDVIVLESGHSFAGTLVLRGARLTVKSSGDERAAILAGSSEGIRAENCSLTLDNMAIQGTCDFETETGNDGCGVVVSAALPSSERVSGLKLLNLKVSGFKRAGICVRGGVIGGLKSGFDGVLIEGCEAFENGGAGIVVGGVMDQFATDYCHRNVHVRSCRSWSNRGIGSQNSHSGSGIVISDVEGGSITQCTAYHNGELNAFAGGGPVGIWCWDCHSVTISHCHSFENRTKTKDGGGFDLDGGCVNCVLEHNYSRDNAGSGYLICQFTNARPFHGNTVRHCISVNDGLLNGGGILVYNDGTGISDCEFHDNLLVSRATEGFEIPAPLRMLTPSVGMNFHDNVFVTDGLVPMVEAVAGQQGLTAFGNIFSDAIGTSKFLWAGKECDLKELKEISGLEWN
ncbi:MAG TPA: right-handed parallel beta-helix repeat-containing protein [Fimbriimonadaceae bacterium]|jgi:hypothetical protein